MNTLKRIFVGIIIIIIVLCAVFYSYSAIENGAVVFATNQDGTLTNDELDVSISSFLQSHGGNIFSPQNYRARKTYEAGLIHNFIYGDGGGYDAVRQHINGGVGGNNELRFDYDGFIIQKLNTWLNRKLQEGEFGEGVELNENGMFNTGIDNNIYDGELFVDDNGNYCFVTVVTTNFTTGSPTFGAGALVKRGSPFIKQGGNDAVQFWEDNNNMPVGGNPTNYPVDYFSFTYKNQSHTYKIYKRSTNEYVASNDDSVAKSYYQKTNSNTYTGYPVIIKGANNYLGYGMLASNNTGWVIGRLDTSKNPDITQVNINFYTNNNNNITVFPSIDADGTLYITPKINVGVDGEINYQPYIVNEGDTINNVINQYYIDSNTPDKTISYPSDDPAGGGGGGGSSDNPSGGTPPDWSNNYPHLSPDGEGGFNFNFTLPDLNIDWNISGLTEKFPFSIPFDLMAFCKILDAEPETPRFEGDLVLPMLTYHIDLNLEKFNTIAQLLRNLEFVGFCIGLILITRSMIKG